MAKAPKQPQGETPATPEQATKAGPEIIYMDPGAEKVDFTPDPNAKRIRVYASGRILTDL